MCTVFGLGLFNKIRKFRSGTDIVEHFIGKVEAVIYGSIDGSGFPAKAIPDHLSEKICIRGIKLLRLLLGQCPILAGICETASNEAVEKFNAGFN